MKFNPSIGSNEKMIKLSRFDVEIIFFVARDIRYKKKRSGEGGLTYDRLRAKITFDLMECSKIPHLLDVHHGTDPVPAADQTVFARPWIKRLSSSSRPPLLIEEISFYFIYGHNVRRGIPSFRPLPLHTFIGLFESRSYISARLRPIPTFDSKKRNFGETFDLPSTKILLKLRIEIMIIHGFYSVY